jgi:hypothetical protein
MLTKQEIFIVNLALPREKRNQEKTSVNTFNNNQPFPIKKTVQAKENANLRKLQRRITMMKNRSERINLNKGCYF